MIKVITLLTRRTGLSPEDFRLYYEQNHRLIGEKYLAGYAQRYVRRYVCPADSSTQYGALPDFDVLMEIWFPDQDSLQAAMTRLTQPAAQEEIIADEEQLFDRAKTVTFIVDENESQLPTLPG